MKLFLIVVALGFGAVGCRAAPAKDALEAHARLEKAAPSILCFVGLDFNSLPKTIAEWWSRGRVDDLRRYEAELERGSEGLIYDCERKKDRDQVRLGVAYPEDSVFFLTLVFWHDGKNSIRQTFLMLEMVPTPKKKEPNQ